MRELCNLAYADLADGRTREQLEELDLLLDEGEDALKAHQQRRSLRQLRGFAAMPTGRS